MLQDDAHLWAFIVSPTDGRPYGLDWEDYGHLDALSVTADALHVGTAGVLAEEHLHEGCPPPTAPQRLFTRTAVNFRLVPPVATVPSMVLPDTRPL